MLLTVCVLGSCFRTLTVNLVSDCSCYPGWVVSLCVCVSKDLAYELSRLQTIKDTNACVCDYTVKLLFYSAGAVSETTKPEQAMWRPTGRHIH